MDLGDGYSLHHVAKGWEYARRRAPGLPASPPSLGFSCGWNGLWLGSAGVFASDMPNGHPLNSWLIAEYLVITDDEWVPPRVRVEGIKRVIPNLLAVGAVMGKRLMFMNTSSGMATILRNMGVVVDDGVRLLTSDTRHL